MPPAAAGDRSGDDSGPGAAQLNVMQAIAEVGNRATRSPAAAPSTTNTCTRDNDCVNDFNTSMPCDATTPFSAPVPVVYTTANFQARKGTKQVSQSGENFDCATWTTTDGRRHAGHRHRRLRRSRRRQRRPT